MIVQKETDTSVFFDCDMFISFFPPDDWVLLEIIYDPFGIWFVISLAMLRRRGYPVSIYAISAKMILARENHFVPHLIAERRKMLKWFIKRAEIDNYIWLTIVFIDITSSFAIMVTMEDHIYIIKEV